MSDINRYLVIDPLGNDTGYEYESFAEAKEIAARNGHAILELQYSLRDTELVWTPDNSEVWA